LLPRRPCHPALSFLLAALSLHASSALTAWAMPTPSPDLPADTRQGYEKVAREILCYCGCARQSIYDCTCGTAHELRDRIEGELKAGKTPEDIIAGFVREHGEQVRCHAHQARWKNHGRGIDLEAHEVVRRGSIRAEPVRDRI